MTRGQTTVVALGLGAWLCGAACWGQGSVTSLFQNGVAPTAAYAGGQDSTLRSLTGYTFGMQSLGRDAAFDPRWSDSEGAALLRFDLSSLPSWAVVTSATLRIWLAADENETNSGDLEVHRLGDPDGTGAWQENTNAVEADYGTAAPSNAMGCAAYKRPNETWTVVGGRVTDVTGAVARAWHVAGTTGWIELDVADDVQAFVQDPAANLGWLVQAAADDTLRGALFTCDAPVASNRPALEVVYGLPAEVPPIADAGADQEWEDEESAGWMLIVLDGSGSTDPNGWIENHVWSIGGAPVATGEIAQIELPAGTNVVELTVTDNDGLQDADEVQIVIRTAATNEPPVLQAIGDHTAWAGYELRFALAATDADGDSVIFTASNLPPGATFLAPDFRWTPTAAQTGTHAGVAFYADDGHGGADSETISILVREATAGGTTWYVRVDGGTPDQCTGLVDAPYPGTGSNQPCAWDHPFRALPPGGAPRIAGGDTLIIGPGSYRMGFGAPGAEACSDSMPWDCRAPPVPGGPHPGNPTRILGAGWATGCTNPPELWGAERAASIFDLTGATNVEIGCLELTDHSDCVEFHTGGLPCPREEYPYGDWAPRGIYAEDAGNVYLHDLDVHGLAHEGIHAGRLADWTVENVRLAGNGWAGWDGDVVGDDGNAGTLTFRNFVVEWNGCGETWPGGAPTGCWSQTAGGYGDGLGTGETGGAWIFEDSRFLHNTSDGLDLLYATRADATIAVRRVWSEGNAGNQLKTAGPARIENCVVVGNCGFFDGQDFTYAVDPCRALGNVLSLSLGPGDQAAIVNCTVAGEGDCLVLADARGAVDGSEKIVLRNNVFLGFADYHQPFENACLTYGEGFAGDPFDVDYSVVAGIKNGACSTGAHDVCASPLLAGMDLAAFDPTLLSNSPAIDAGVDRPEFDRDVDGRPRPLDGTNDGTNRWDVGAREFVHPLADSDGDRMRDADEIVAGTDATNAAAWFAVDGARPGFVLDWWGVAGRRYDVETASAVAGEWTALAGATNLPGADAQIVLTNAPPAEGGFYRVRVRRP